MDSLDEEIDRTLRLALSWFVGALLICIATFMLWSWLEDDPDPLREFQFECLAAGGLNTRGVMVSEDGTKVKHFSLCLPASLGSEGLQ